MKYADVEMVECEPLVGEAYNTGFMAALSEAYESICDTCEDEITLLAN